MAEQTIDMKDTGIDGLDGWAMGLVSSLFMQAVDMPASPFGRVSLIVGENGAIKPDRIRVEVSDRAYEISVSRADDQGWPEST